MITIRWVAGKQHRKLGVFWSDTTNSDYIANWRMAGERASKTAPFTYISYCDMITTQILNWAPKSWVCEWVEPAKKLRVRCGLVFWCGKTRCNGSSSVPTPTQNRTANLEPLLTLPYLQNHKSLMLHGRSFSEWGGDHSLSILPIKAANTLVTHNSDQITV